MKVTLRNDPADGCICSVYLSLKKKTQEQAGWQVPEAVIWNASVAAMDGAQPVNRARQRLYFTKACVTSRTSCLSALYRAAHRTGCPSFEFTRMAQLLTWSNSWFFCWFVLFARQDAHHDPQESDASGEQIWAELWQWIGVWFISSRKRKGRTPQRLTKLLVSSRFLDHSYVDGNVQGVPFPQNMFLYHAFIPSTHCNTPLVNMHTVYATCNCPDSCNE